MSDPVAEFAKSEAIGIVRDPTGFPKKPLFPKPGQWSPMSEDTERTTFQAFASAQEAAAAYFADPEVGGDEPWDERDPPTPFPRQATVVEWSELPESRIKGIARAGLTMDNLCDQDFLSGEDGPFHQLEDDAFESDLEAAMDQALKNTLERWGLWPASEPSAEKFFVQHEDGTIEEVEKHARHEA